MRKIKFRGFSTNFEENEWFEGDLIHYDEDVFCIIEQNYDYHRLIGHPPNTLYDGVIVDKNSIGQSTGFKDRLGNEIYEGDILEFKDGGIVYVSWDVEYTGFILIDPTGYQETEGIGNWILENVEVVGNIFDNKKLLDDY